MTERLSAESGSAGGRLPVWLYLLTFLSGVISLGYQVMWFRIYADRFGSTTFTFLIVIIAFIGGLGAGALASRRILHWAGNIPLLSRPLRLVGWIELAIAATALLTWILDLSGAGASSTFPYVVDERGIFEPHFTLQLATGLGAALMLLPTFLMGTTFPILCRAFREREMLPSELYGWNTLGACLGVLAAEFILLRFLGHSTTFMVLVAANVLLGLAFMSLGRFGDVGRSTDETEPEAQASSKDRRKKPGKPLFEPAVLLAVATLSGFVTGALEMDMFRAVRFAGAITDAAMSFTSFWAIAAIFAASWTVRALGPPRPWLVRSALAGSCLVHAATWIWLTDIRRWFDRRFVDWVTSQAHLHPDVANPSIQPLGASLEHLLLFTGVIVFPAYYLASLPLPAVCNASQAQKRHLGGAYGLNTLAFCAGAVIFSWAAPRVSLFYAVKLVVAVTAICAALALTLRPYRPLSRLALGSAVAAAVACAIFIPGSFDRSFFSPTHLAAQHPVYAMKSDGVNTTYIVRPPERKVLFFDSYPMSGTSPHSQQYMRLMAHMPLLAQHDPKDALLICFGVGNTARAIASHESIRSIDIVDLNDKVFETADEFAETNLLSHRDPRVRLIHDDGRRFLERYEHTYDLVTSEPPPPRAAGVYRLYSVEYYRAILERLSPEGTMTQWLPMNTLSGNAARRMVATFVEVFPHSLLFVGFGHQLILMGSRQPFDAALLESRFAALEGPRADLAALGLTEPLQLLARIMRPDEALREDVRGVPVISDENNDLALAVTDPFDPPRVLQQGERVLQSLPLEQLACGDRLREILIDPGKLLVVVPDFYPDVEPSE